mmetsp:Transcript_10047/g.13439  ORF Transcript_10047/g.13439 Transcript_10047/m.13439 type:complete len:118 (+) Transcript_10047:51-404(+)
MSLCRHLIHHNRRVFSPAYKTSRHHQRHIGAKRTESSSSSSSQNVTKTTKKNQDEQSICEKDLKWTERKEAPKWLQKMAPSKGGTSMPNKMEMGVISVVALVGGYAWFCDPGSWVIR